MRQHDAPTAELYRELSDEIYRLLSTRQIAGYFSDDRYLSFVNVNKLPESLSKEITALCTLNFNQYIAVIPIQEVLISTERDHRAQEILSNVEGNVTLLYFSAGPKDSIKKNAKTTHDIASLSNPSVRCSIISLELAEVLDETAQFPPRLGEQYVCLVHLSGLVGLSAVLTTYEVEQLSIMRYLRESSGENDA
jgi:hypothetical protein